MADKRASTKVSKNVWLDDTIRDLAVAALKKKGLEFSEVVLNMLKNLIEKELTKQEQNEIKKKTLIQRESRLGKKNKKIRPKAKDKP